MLCILTATALLFGCKSVRQDKPVYEQLLTDYAETPGFTDTPFPAFSWIINPGSHRSFQKEYQVLVADERSLLESGRANCWDSGRQVSDETLHIVYAGKPLKSNHIYYWKVIITDENGAVYESKTTWFRTTILEKTDWEAKWIGKGPANDVLPEKGFFGSTKEQVGLVDTIRHDGCSLLLRKEFQTGRKVVSATVFVSGLGIYEFYINGKRVGEKVLSPAKTPYHKHVLYDAYEVSDRIHPGKNVLAFHVGNGWYNPYKKWWAQYRMQWFGHKKAVARMEISYSDGSSEAIVTDESWKWHDGPVTFNCIYDGEIRNAQMEPEGWKLPGFNDKEWNPVFVFENQKAELVYQKMPAIQVNETITPVEITKSGSKERVFDMKQNFAGWVKITMKGEKGTRLKIRYAEDVDSLGRLDPSSNENAKATNEYITGGNKVEEYEPSFTYSGFRYVGVSSDKPLKIKQITGCVVYSANRSAGKFESSCRLVNQIHHATVWSQKSNMLGYPMDCPQRDERLGWLGDAQVSAEQAMFNFDMALFYKNWFRGIKANQDKSGDLPIISPQPYMPDEGIEWSSSFFTMIWQYYLCYGDKRILEENYETMEKYLRFLEAKATDFILPKGWIGDWGSLVNGWKEGEPESVPTAFYEIDAEIMTKTARVLGKFSDAQKYGQLRKNIMEAYNRKYLDFNTGKYLSGTQMDQAMPLFMEIVPEKIKDLVLKNLVDDIQKNDNHLTTGVLGTKYMPEALVLNGKTDVAWKLINRKTYPGWAKMMEKYTTTCEFWTLKQSKNHVMMGSIDAWFYKYLAGVQWDEKHPGWKHFYIKPELPGDLDFAKAELETLRGKISSSWKKTGQNTRFNIEVPFNTTATFQLPALKSLPVYENNKLVSLTPGEFYLGYKNGRHEFLLKPGCWKFEVKTP